MGNNWPFGFDPEDFDRVAREAGEGLREALGKFMTSSGERAGWSVLFDEFTRGTRARTEPETTGETGDGVWAIYTVDEDGGACHALEGRALDEVQARGRLDDAHGVPRLGGETHDLDRFVRRDPTGHAEEDPGHVRYSQSLRPVAVVDLAGRDLLE